ncbi:unnamed protein product [Allacma fusca]|uniref:NACHT domain-containing protein n=1 Tax=Allacma fusca TaxID=39272 RepID=A0A8J2K6X3_9HEXA|nr:unnamed protein product [Allacma fusca]
MVEQQHQLACNINTYSMEGSEGGCCCILWACSSPPINITKSQPIVSQGSTRFSTRASLRSWGRAATMDKDPGIIPFLQQALALRYREMLNTYLQQAPPWFQAHMGSTDLEEICPVVYQVLQEKNSSSIYGTTTSKKLSSERQHDSYKPILPHQIFAKTCEDDMSRAFWLEGEPGSGKTLLCCRILSEWVSYHSYNYTNSPLNTRIGEFQVLFYVPLREVRGSLSRFLMRELIPKRSILSRMKPANVWKCLNLLGNSMLLVLDGLDDVTDEDLLKEIQDVLNGQMFPQSMVLVTSTSRPPHCEKVNSWMNRGPVRKYLVNGMDWTQIQCCIRRYFTGRKFRNETRMAEILSDRHDLCALASNPFMCLLLCSVFEEVGDVPVSNAELYLCLIRSLIYQNGLIKVDTNSGSPCKDNSIPPKYRKALEDFGKLALHKFSEIRVHYSESEVLDYCQNTDIIKCGVLTKWKGFFRKTAKKSTGHHPLTIFHPSLNTFLAAYYLATTVNYPAMLRREMQFLPGIEGLQMCQVRPDNMAFSVVELLMELLQKNSFSVFSTLSLLDISMNYLLALLRAAGFYETNLSAVCSIMRSLKHVSINVGSEWVSELKQVLSSDHCPFESLEVVIKPGYSLSRLIEGLCLNESIHSVKFSSVPGQDWSGVEVNLICGQLLQLLSEKKLKCLEISMTCLEDKEHSRFQAVVDSLCFLLSKQIPLQKLVLDMDLTSPQVIQLASFIKCHEFIDVLHLPHLGCGPEGLRAIAELLYSKPFLSLSLAGTWRSVNAEDDMDIVVEPVPLNSPFHIGTMSSLTKGGFSSLPRGPLNGSIKSPSIRRKKMSHLTENDKRNSDSALFQRNFLPLPICDQPNHELDGFHSIFSVLRFGDSACNLKSLNIGKCVLGWEDVICLGETIRKTTCLDTLRMEGMKLCDVLPVLLGLQENTSLKMLDLSSPHVVIGDDALQLACQSLAKNHTLRLLSLQGWTFYIEEERSLESVQTLFRSTKLQDLDLTGVRVHISSSSKSKSPGNSSNSDKSSAASSLEKKCAKEVKQKEKMASSRLGKKPSISSVMSLGLGLKKICPDLSFLRIGGMQVELGKSQVWRSMDIVAQLLPFVDKGKITHLDVSIDKNDSNFTIEDKVVMKTMKLIGQNFPKLQRLVCQHWRMKLSEKSCKELGKYLQGLDSLSGISLDHCVVTCESAGLPNKRIDHLLTSSVLSSVKCLSDFSWANFDPLQMPQLARALCDHHSVVPTLGGLTVKLDQVPLAAIKLLISNSLAKNNSSGVVIEYAGNHSVLVKKLKEKSDHLMHKLKRLL